MPDFPPLLTDLVEARRRVAAGSSRVFRGDVRSADWDGGGDLSGGADASATQGYLIDYSSGAAQFQAIYANEADFGGYVIIEDADGNAVEIDASAWGGAAPKIDFVDHDQVARGSISYDGYLTLRGGNSGGIGAVLHLYPNTAGGGYAGVIHLDPGTGGDVLVDSGIRADDGSASTPTYSFQDDSDTGAFLPAVGEYGVAVGGSQLLSLDSTGLEVTGDVAATTGYIRAGSANSDDYIRGQEAGNYWRFVIDGSTYFEVTNGTVNADDGSTGLVEIFPKNYIAAGTSQAASLTFNTTETKFNEQTIACEYANQPVVVEVKVWARAQPGAGNYLWCRAGINGTAKGAQVPLHDASNASEYVMVQTSWTEETTADGSGDVKVSAHARLSSGSTAAGVVQVEYKVSRR